MNHHLYLVLISRAEQSRAEVREDFKRELEELEFSTLADLKQKALDASEPEEFFDLKDDLDDSLAKFLRF